ncbi:proline dehydrogenase family protein [Mucilaginibacter flavus]|uniref:proline dehydrogenase family protein n=1 Tax=Mucilaginibacter flavus TaxID=931504 RepID=UPI0025B4A34A|nr:proline dehydrogenase family protein [Mucilaginibacter flavus]MDN3584239.1 proline dehydrogenase family protein [Mucilaginibacter flavus]
MSNLKYQAGHELKKAALNITAKNYVLNNPVLFNLLLKGARRYIGGQNLAEVIATVKQTNSSGIPVAVEFMGESVASAAEANEATTEFLELIETIKADKLSSFVALDLSHIGLSVSLELAFTNLLQLAEATKNTPIELIISAEGVERTNDVLDIFSKASPLYPQLGITVQAYLHRSMGDLENLINNTQGRIRLVKGAFAAPEDLILQRGDALDARYLQLVELLLINNRKCAIASHHDKIHSAVKELLKLHETPAELYEFEMLYGIQEELLKSLQASGYPCRQYIVYGREWYLYLCNRIAEYPDNLFRFLIDVLKQD